MFVAVRDNNADQALRVLKKKMQREGLFREMKNRRAFENHLNVGPVRPPNPPAVSENRCASAWSVRILGQNNFLLRFLI